MDTPPATSHGYSLTDAAARLGIPREAVRARIRRGKIAAAKVGGQWVVYLPTGEASQEVATGAASAPAAPMGTATGSDQAAQIADLQDQVRWLRARVEAAEAERAELRRLLAGAMQALPSPTDARRGEPHRGEGPGERAAATMPRAASEKPVARRKRPPWWYRWFRRRNP